MRTRTILLPLLFAASALAAGCVDRDEGVALWDAPECRGDECPPDPDTDTLGEEFERHPHNCKGESCECELGPAGGFCMTAYCGVTMEPGTLAATETIRVQGITAPASYADQLLGSRACAIGALETKPRRPFEVIVEYEAQDVPFEFHEDDVMGVHLDPLHTLAQDTALDVRRNRVSFSAVSGGITVGATVMPVEERLADVWGVPQFSVTDPATFLQSLSQHHFGASWFDGERFYLANGPRVLIWNDGLPHNMMTPPDVVLGRPDLESDFLVPSASAFSSSVQALWTDGERLAVAEGNRVLIWNSIPDTSFAPADVILGHEDFTGFAPNRGLTRPTDATLSAPKALWSDGERFVVADTMNHRFLIWNRFPAISGQPADLVLGQEDFQGNEANAGQLEAYQPWGVYSDGERLAVASRFSCECFQVYEEFPTESNAAPDYVVGTPDPINRVDPTTFSGGTSLTGFGEDGIAFRNGARVSIWREFPDSTRPADITLGKPTDTIGGSVGIPTASSFMSTDPSGHVWSGNGVMMVGDGHRLLVWDELPSVTFEAADRVFGQASFGTIRRGVDYRGVRPESLSGATSISSAGDITVVADPGNNRVLVLRGADPFRSTDVTVLGQPNGRSFFSNRGGAVSPASMSSPYGVYTNGTSIYVADTGNHRVLIWDEIPERDGAPADVALGQRDLRSGQQNGGLGDEDGDGDIDADASTLHYPAGIAVDDGVLYVADTYNHRVLVWDGIPSDTGRAADRVLGQPDLRANDPNRGLGLFARNRDTLSAPIDVTVLGDGHIAVSDSFNNRVLLFDRADSGASAYAVLGQDDFTSDRSPEHHTGTNHGLPRTDSSKTADASSLRRPAEIEWTGRSLVVADRGNHRVVEYDALATGIEASRVFGQPDVESRHSNESSVTRSTLASPAGVATAHDGVLLIADTGNHRVLGYDGDTTATDVFGQRLFHQNGFNGSSPAVDSLRGPDGVALEPDGRRLWVADRGNHRVIRFDGPRQMLVLGQADRGGASENSGFAGPRAWTLREPADVWTDGERLIVADRGNHRVLVWNRLPTRPDQAADVVIGQTRFERGEINGGTVAWTGPGSLFAPSGVEVDDEGTLYIADTGNNRVLIYDEIPQRNGAPADRVICQSSFYENLPNRGIGRASAEGCSGPRDVMVARGNLWVADSLNNRVLRFPMSANGTSSAELVLGQPEMTDRRPAAGLSQPSAASLSNPSRLAYDGRTFWVVDRGHNRILKWDRIPTQTFTPANQVLGQEAMDTAVASGNTEGLNSPSGVAVMPGEFNQSTVFVSDAGRDRVAVFDHVARPF